MRTASFSILLLSVVATAVAGGGSDGDDVHYLRRAHAELQALPEARRQQIEELDAALHALGKDQQERLVLIMQRYNYWLGTLTPADRKRVVDAPTAHERLKVIQELKDQEWIATLPKALREKYAHAKEADRLRLVGMWREEEHERREEWRLVRRHGDELRDDKFAAAFHSKEFHQNLDAYVQNLETQLTPYEHELLKKARDKKAENGAWFRYLVVVVELSDRYALLPGPHDGPRTFAALPLADREAILEKLKKKPFPKELTASAGKWPQYAIEVSKYARLHNIKLPVPLGPGDRLASTMPETVRAFINEKLEPALEKAAKQDKTGSAKHDLERLSSAIGKWPEYPQTVMDLAKQYNLFVPGWMLPGDAKMWDRFRLRPFIK